MTSTRIAAAKFYSRTLCGGRRLRVWRVHGLRFIYPQAPRGTASSRKFSSRLNSPQVIALLDLFQVEMREPRKAIMYDHFAPFLRTSGPLSGQGSSIAVMIPSMLRFVSRSGAFQDSRFNRTSSSDRATAMECPKRSAIV